MTFDDIPLYEAIHEIYQHIVSNPRSDYWLKSPGMEQLCRLVVDNLPLSYIFPNKWRVEDIVSAWATYGRTGNKDEFGRMELVVEVARAHGRRCFYAQRGKGECSPEVTLDRIVPGSRDGAYTIENTMLACSHHNSQRGNQAIEDYLAAGVLANVDESPASL